MHIAFKNLDVPIPTYICVICISNSQHKLSYPYLNHHLSRPPPKPDLNYNTVIVKKKCATGHVLINNKRKSDVAILYHQCTLKVVVFSTDRLRLLL